MPYLPIVKAFALKGLRRLTIVCSVKVYKACVVAIGCLISLSVAAALERLASVSLLSGVDNYRLIDRLLS